MSSPNSSLTSIGYAGSSKQSPLAESGTWAHHGESLPSMRSRPYRQALESSQSVSIPKTQSEGAVDRIDHAVVHRGNPSRRETARNHAKQLETKRNGAVSNHAQAALPNRRKPLELQS